MPVEKVTEVAVGSVLARPVEDSMGRILINAGEPLTEQLINVLKKRGFAEVEVRPTAEPSHAEHVERKVTTKLGITPEQLAAHGGVTALREELASRFEGVPPGNEAMKAVRTAVEHVLIERELARPGGRSAK